MSSSSRRRRCFPYVIIGTMCLLFYAIFDISLLFHMHTSPTTSYEIEGQYISVASKEGAELKNSIQPNSPDHSLIPSTIWQIYIGADTLNTDVGWFMNTWAKLNSEYSYTRLSRQGGVDFVREHYQHRPDLVALFTNLRVPILVADLLRYMILAARGGIYADLDVAAMASVRHWIPKKYHDSQVAVIIGIEYDRRNDKDRHEGFFQDIQFCQWTMAAAPNNPLLVRVVDRVAKSIAALAERQGRRIDQLAPSDDDVLQTTGPVIWTTSILESLSAAAGRQITFHDLTGIQEPTLFGDVLVLSIDALNTGIDHSGSGDHPEQILVRHGFRSTWRGKGGEIYSPE